MQVQNFERLVLRAPCTVSHDFWSKMKLRFCTFRKTKQQNTSGKSSLVIWESLQNFGLKMGNAFTFHWRDQIKNVEKKWEFFIFVTSSDQSFVLYLSKLLCTKYEVKRSILAIQPPIQTNDAGSALLTRTPYRNHPLKWSIILDFKSNQKRKTIILVGDHFGGFLKPNLFETKSLLGTSGQGSYVSK